MRGHPGGPCARPRTAIYFSICRPCQGAPVPDKPATYPRRIIPPYMTPAHPRAYTDLSCWLVGGVARRVQKAQQSPNTRPARLSRLYKAVRYLLASGQKKTPATRDGGKVGRKKAGILAPHRQGNWLVVLIDCKLCGSNRARVIAALPLLQADCIHESI